MFQQQQREPLTEFISCPVCCKVFNDNQQRPMSLSCGHTVCKACLHGRLGNERCPFDQVPFPKDAENLPSNFALMQLVEATSIKERADDSLQGSEYDPKCYEVARQCIQEISIYLKPLAENSSDDEGTSTSSAADRTQVKCFLSRPLQRKVISLIQCQIIEEDGRARAARIARSIGERVLCEILTAWQYPHQLSANLWAAVRARGCQFLGPAMQEEVLKLILLTLETGCMLSRKVLVLYVVGKLSSTYPHVSKTAIGHVVQLLYRASCFKVTKRDEESSLMQLKEEFREYDALRREHDAQIVQIAMEAGLRIPPEQWSSLLYGDMAHKSHMQSVMDKLQNAQSFSQCVLELVQVLQRNGDPGGFLKLRHRFEFLSCIDPNPDAQVPSLHDIKAIMQSLSMVMTAFVNFMSQPSANRRGVSNVDGQAVPNAQYKTSMCWDVATKGYCPRGNTCTFAHSQQELERHRQKSRRSMYKPGLKSDGSDGGVGKQEVTSEDKSQIANLSLDGSCPANNVCAPPSQGVTSGNNGNSHAKDHSWSTHSSTLTTDQATFTHKNNNGKAVVNASPPSMPSPSNSSVNGTLLTFSQPAKEAPGINFVPQTGFQTSFHPHNMRGPPPPLHHPHQSFIPPESGYSHPRSHIPSSSSNLVNYPSCADPQQNVFHHPHYPGQPLQPPMLQQPPLPPHQQHPTCTTTTSVVHNHPHHHQHQHHVQYLTHSNNLNSSSAVTVTTSSLPHAPVVSMSSNSQNLTFSSYNQNKAAVRVEEQHHHHHQSRNEANTDGQTGVFASSEPYKANLSVSSSVDLAAVPVMTNSDGINCYQQPHNLNQQQHSAMRMGTHLYGGPGYLQSLTNSNSAMSHHHHHTPQTPVIPAVVVDVSTQQEPIFLPHPPAPPPMGIAGHHDPHLHPLPSHLHQHLPLQRIPPLPPHPSTMIPPYAPLVQYVPTPSPPFVQIPNASTTNIVMWNPEFDVAVLDPNEVVAVVPAEMSNLAETVIVDANQAITIAAIPPSSSNPGEAIMKSNEGVIESLPEETLSTRTVEEGEGQ